MYSSLFHNIKNMGSSLRTIRINQITINILIISRPTKILMSNTNMFITNSFYIFFTISINSFLLTNHISSVHNFNTFTMISFSNITNTHKSISINTDTFKFNTRSSSIKPIKLSKEITRSNSCFISTNYFCISFISFFNIFKVRSSSIFFKCSRIIKYINK